MPAPLSCIITLLTDFGTADPFVGVMKGVILGRFADATLVDLTHEIRPQGIAEAAFWLEKSFPWFPPGTVHLAVVDPGVGTDRAAVVVCSREHLFVGPDNGLFARVLGHDPDARVRRIDVESIDLREPSRTFHGRDLFAPVAAEIAGGHLPFERVGPEHERPAMGIGPEPARRPGEVRGRVITVDHFGNLITDIESELLAGIQDPVVHLGRARCPLRGTYAEVGPGDLVGVVGSFGTVEIARRDGSAQALLAAEPGEEVMVRAAAKP